MRPRSPLTLAAAGACLVTACVAARQAGDRRASPREGTLAAGAATSATSPDPSPVRVAVASPPPCPVEMALIAPARACIDRWEARVEVMLTGRWVAHSPFEPVDPLEGFLRATSNAGVLPQGYISGAAAQAACQGAGKRLCSANEFRVACRGTPPTPYPYGGAYERGTCNEGRSNHPVVELFGADVGVWDAEHMNDARINQQPATLAPTGAHTACASAFGAFDLVGNLHEWVDDVHGTFLGGYYVDAEKNGHGCSYTTTAHGFGYHDYSTGFRCCLTPLTP